MNEVQWDRINADFHIHDWWSDIHCVALSPVSPVVRAFNSSAPEIGKSLTLLGFPVRIDVTLPPGEVRLEGANGVLVRVVNIGEP